MDSTPPPAPASAWATLSFCGSTGLECDMVGDSIIERVDGGVGGGSTVDRVAPKSGSGNWREGDDVVVVGFPLEWRNHWYSEYIQKTRGSSCGEDDPEFNVGVAAHINSLTPLPFISLRVAHLGAVLLRCSFEPLPRSDKCGTPGNATRGCSGGPADVMLLPRAGRLLAAVGSCESDSEEDTG